jgi:peptide/nickel transport system substrate-binding protein
MERHSYWWRFQKARMSRRRLIQTAGIATAGVAGAALIGCGGDEEEGPAAGSPMAGAAETALTPVADEGTPQYGGHLVTGTKTVFGGLDPQLCVDCYAFADNIHGYLYSVDYRDYSYDAQMAESMERVDDVTYIWKLRPGIKFHNVDPTWGREVTAEDVAYSYTRRRDEPTSQNDKQLLRDYTASFEATDQYTFRLVTTRPYSPTFDELGNPSYAIVPREAVEKWGTLMQNAVGCGAYMLDGFTKGDRVKYVRNPDFYMEGLPYIDSREVQIIPDEGTLTQAFETKRHDTFGGSEPNPLKVERWLKTDGIVVRKYWNYWRRTFMLKVDKPPFSDIRVRKAIDLALDRQDFIDKMWFGEGKIAGPVVPDMEPWSLPQEEVDAFYKLDLAEAKALLAAAGHEDGLDVELTVQNVADLSKYAEIAKEHLAKVGINLKLTLQELGVYLAQTLYPGNFEMTIYYNLPYEEPDRPLCQWFSKGQAGISFSGYNNPEADEWIWKERSEFDFDKRLEIIHDAQRFFMKEHGPQISTHTDQGYVAFWKWVHGADSQRKGNRGRGGFAGLGVTDWLTERT